MTNIPGRILAAFICLLGLPAHIALCIAIRLQDRQFAIYRSARLGRCGKVFNMLKYRTMKVGCPPLMSPGLKLVVAEADPRITRLGVWLRCGIDELPQLWNIVRGDMTWIGPRPDPDWMLSKYGLSSRARLSILPGITGLAQVLDSRNLRTEEGYAIDLWYLSHRSLWMDAWIASVTPFFMAGLRSIGREYLGRLRSLPEFKELLESCNAEMTELTLKIGSDAEALQAVMQ